MSYKVNMWKYIVEDLLYTDDCSGNFSRNMIIDYLLLPLHKRDRTTFNIASMVIIRLMFDFIVTCLSNAV